MPVFLLRIRYAARAARVLALGSLLLLLALPARSNPGVSDRPKHAGLTLLAAGDLRGEIKPCGCSPEGQLGGLPRRLTYLQQAYAERGTPPLLVDLGNNFPEPSAQGRLKIELIQRLLSRYKPAAILPGPNELAFGLGALAHDLPYMISNVRGESPLPAFTTAEREGTRIGLYGYLSPGLVYQGKQVRLLLEPAGATLFGRMRETAHRERHAVRVLLFRGSDAELASFVESGAFDAIVVGNPSADELNQVTERTVAGRTLPQVPTKGQGLLRLQVPLQGGAPGSGTVAVDWLSDRYADHPDAVAAFARYDKQVKALFFARLQTMEQHRKESPYVGADACATCHAAAAKAWHASRHSHALATLEGVGKQFDPECLACHVVGLERDGFLSKDLTPGLANVQCENCHGPGRAHAANPAVKPGPVPSATGETMAKPGPATCRTCHRGSHSPTFEFDTYWPRIRHGK